MSFEFDLDRILETGAKVVDSAKKTAVDLAQRGKKQADLLAAQAKQAKAERQLGALVYSLAKNGEQNDALVRKYLDALATIEAEIERLRAETPTEATAAPGSEPTPTAEQPASEEPTPEAPATVACPQCGAGVEPDALFCNGCGAQL